MSTAETSPPPIQEPKKSPQDASKALTDAERADLTKKLSNPLDFPPEFRTWLEGFIETALPTSKSFQALAANYAFPVGFQRWIPEDLSAHTGEYVWTDSNTGIQFLYANGAAVSQTTYADLYAAWGASKWKADSGGNFYLPDTLGRSIWTCGTNAATDLGDNDGVIESSRQPKHTHSLSGSTGSGGVTHTHDDNTAGGSQAQAYSSGTVITAGNSGLTQTGAPTAYLHTHTLSSGSAGSGMSGSDAVAHIVLGSIVFRF